MPNNGGLAGLRGGIVALQSEAAWQWQPGLTVHDPSPPITLNSPAAAAILVASALQSPMLESVMFGAVVR